MTMTPEEKQLLLKDLSARLPYGVKIHGPKENDNILWELDYNMDVKEIVDDGWLPYLRPLSSMTEEEKKYLENNFRFYFDECSDGITNGIYSAKFNRTIYQMINEDDISNIIDWLNAHHFDFRGLIKKGLALEAPEGMYKTN